MQLIQSLTHRDHIGYRRWVLHSKGLKYKLADPLHNVTHPICLWHIPVDPTAQRKNVLYIRRIRLLGMLHAIVQLFLRGVRTSS